MIFLFQSSLQVLNIAGNNLDSIKDIECLRNLYQLHANDNLLTDMKELAHVIGGMFRLWRLDLMGNPLCHKAKYRDRVIVMAKNLGKTFGNTIGSMDTVLHLWNANACLKFVLLSWHVLSLSTPLSFLN